MRGKSITATAWSGPQPTALMSSLLCPRLPPSRLSTYSKGNQVGNRLGTVDVNKVVYAKYQCVFFFSIKSRELQLPEGPASARCGKKTQPLQEPKEGGAGKWGRDSASSRRGAESAEPQKTEDQRGEVSHPRSHSTVVCMPQFTIKQWKSFVSDDCCSST